MINFYEYYMDGEILDNYSYMSGFFNICNICWGEDTKNQLEPYLPLINKSSNLSYRYARYVIKDRWVEGEPVIMKDSYYVYVYARDVIVGRWMEAEPIIMKSPHAAALYARFVMRVRWLEAEDTIKKDEYWWGEYKKVYKI